MEKEKQRIEDEKEYKRIMEQQERIKAELEEELRKKRAKEEHGQRLADDAKRLADEKKKESKTSNAAAASKRTITKPVNKKFQRNSNTNKSTDDFNQFASNADLNNGPTVEFRTNSPPVPAAAKKLNGGGAGAGKTTPKKSNNSDFGASRPSSKGKEIAPDYFVTESRLNLSSPVKLCFLSFQAF